MNTLLLHIKHKDNSEECQFIPLSKFKLLSKNGVFTLQINQKIKTKTKDPFFVTLCYTDDPYVKPKGLIINLGYIVLRIRLTMGKVISTNPFTYETQCTDNLLFQWKLPLRMPTENNPIPYSTLNITKKGDTYFEWDINGSDNTFALKYNIYIPELKQGFKSDLRGNMNSLYNNIKIIKETKINSNNKHFKL
jgi:hypothetical protein